MHPAEPIPPAPGRPQGLVVRAAMFDNLSQSINKAWKMVQKDGKLTPDNMKEPMKEIRRALLEADVSLPVVRRFVKRIEERALGVEVLDGVSPDVQFVKVRRRRRRRRRWGRRGGWWR